MTCKHCRVPMRELRGVFHGKRKWRCPKCGRHRMQRPRRRPGKGRRPDPE